MGLTLKSLTQGGHTHTYNAQEPEVGGRSIRLACTTQQDQIIRKNKKKKQLKFDF